LTKALTARMSSIVSDALGLATATLAGSFFGLPPRMRTAAGVPAPPSTCEPTWRFAFQHLAAHHDPVEAGLWARRQADVWCWGEDGSAGRSAMGPSRATRRPASPTSPSASRRARRLRGCRSKGEYKGLGEQVIWPVSRGSSSPLWSLLRVAGASGSYR